MARNHENSSVNETTLDDGNERKATKRKKRSGFAAPIPIPTETSEKPAVERSKPSALDEALANLAIKKRETAEEKPAEAEKPAETTEANIPEDTLTHEPEATDETAEENKAEEVEVSNESEEKLEDQEVQPNEFSGGEVVIHLQGEQPVAERVIPLHNDHEEVTPPTPSPEEAAEPVYSRQAEQQHQAREETPVPPPESSAMDDREAPPGRPAGVPEAQAEQFPEPERPTAELIEPRPEDIYEPIIPDPNLTATPHVVGGEHPATKQEVEDAVYYATKSGQNRGVLTGLLVAGGYEHFKHKRREKRQEKRFQKQSKQLEQNRADQHFFFDDQAKRQMNTEQRFAAAERRFEQHFHPEKQPAKPEQHRLDTPEQLAIPADHRLETSAWHSIEIDNKTGRAVENPAFTYGKEYYRERAQEATPKQQRNAATGEVALVAAAMGQSDSSNPPAAPPIGMPNIPLATTQGSPTKAALKSGLKSLGSSDSDNSNQGPLWPWLVALVVVVICLIVVIG